ncbi:hypothetical protein [Calothrix sp. PCC 6303]|uniref:hypothetical protein n=1 Tax=Calothrix sp. PCC 6303 TaxID=1170562 RepID=UPI0002A03571|nr:hypothetical protein [Calothrix sp. PCC 6303]AFZ00191.1 hypothetical protein Cal6303_1129 [Calothrix sp. PCC 6303]
MKTNVALTNPSLFSSVVFKDDFNHFEKIKATQAWSLLLTAGRADKALGLSSKVGRFLNLGLIAIAGFAWIFLFRPF